MTGMRTEPSVSIITPTYGREALLRAACAMVARQTNADFEWLILDDSPQPSPFFANQGDPRIRYVHHAGTRLSIGAKRNRLIESARAEIIVQFDDDDYYAPSYLAKMVARMGPGDDVLKLSGWFLYSCVYRMLGYWDLNLKQGLHNVWSRNPMTGMMITGSGGAAWVNNHLGYGFSYVFRKSAWRKAPFPDQNFGEDSGFIGAALAAGCCVNHFVDTDGLCLHILHPGNTSRCFPQYVLPPFMFDRYFPSEARAMLEM